MSEEYIKNHFDDIKKYANVVENRLDDSWCTLESVLEDNKTILAEVQKHKVSYILIDGRYELEL